MSYSNKVYNTFQKNSKTRKFSSILYIVLTTIYLVWRITTLNENYLFISSLYYLAEIIGFIIGLLIIYSSWNISYNKPKALLQKRKVDIFIPSYKENIDIIKKTLMAAKNVTYPHETWVLDDANRSDVKEFAQLIGINYLTREKNIDAKAGNLNNALSQTNAEFILVFDADHIPQPYAIDTILGYFENENVAMVQTPQDYYNTSAFQYINAKKSKKLWHDQSFFYTIALSAADNVNAASCVGTGVAYRRTSLEKIGNIPTTTITEDLHTSLKLHKLGYKTVYVNEPIAYGIAATDLDEYYTTRHRWAHGNLSALKEEKILTCKGLSFKQRLFYLSFGLVYLEGWQQLILFLIPIIALVFGIPPFEISIFNILIILFFPIISYIILQEVGSGFSRFWPNEIFSMIRWPIHLMASFALIGKKLKWKSSKKRIKGEINLNLMLPQLFMLTLSSLALIFAINKINGNLELGPIAQYIIDLVHFRSSYVDINTTLDAGYSVELVVIAGFWAFFNILKVIIFIIKVFSNTKKSKNEFYLDLNIPFYIDNNLYFADKISEYSIIVNRNTYPGLDKVKEIDLLLPNGKLKVNVKFNTLNETFETGKFLWVNYNQQSQLINTIFSPAWYMDAIYKNSTFSTPSQVLAKFIFLKQSPLIDNQTWVTSVLIVTNQGQEFLTESICLYGIGKKYSSIICFEELKPKDIISLVLSDKEGLRYFSIASKENISSINNLGLHGKNHYRYKVVPLTGVITTSTKSAIPLSIKSSTVS